VRALVTGAKGFVGQHLCRYLADQGDDVLGTDAEYDITSSEELHSVFDGYAPDVVYHLAGRTHVGESWNDPSGYTKVNVVGTKNVLDAAWRVSPEVVTLVVSSSDVYGDVPRDQLPINELHTVAPLSPYATSKIEAENVAHEVIRSRKQRVLIARPFNHIGPGQAPTFVVPALATRFLDARSSGAETIPVGDLSSRRDFVDVRDVVRAYRLLVQHGQLGATYNIASGHDTGIEEIAEMLRHEIAPHVQFVTDQALLRPMEPSSLRGDFTKLHEATGWEPRISLRQTLSDVISALERAGS
jgi:GDP-4-dehydro-6-deoxy-D-mannose reductase